MNDSSDTPLSPQRDLTETSGSRADSNRELADLQVVYVMAGKNPRDELRAIDRIENAFTRLGLAEKAQYAYSRGGTDIRGPSIKAMEQIAAIWGNVDAAWRVRSRGVDQHGIGYSEIETVAVDLQTRTRKRIGFIVPHWRDTNKGGYMLQDERDIYELCANQAQRRVRACLEAIIPGDVVEIAMLQADKTLKAKADTGPEAMLKMVDAFAEFGVTKEQIEKRIQRHLSAITAAQVVGLKRIYASLRDGMSDAGEWFEATGPKSAEGTAPATEGAGTAAVKSRMKASAKKKGSTAPAGKGATVMSYAEVVDAINDATTLDAVNDAGDLIKHVADPQQRAELETVYRARAAEFEG
ncbi:hypothetical protein [Paraburkholderia adhaesiva]|uniref:hypothetical protein n=1 Tax=Paraburkholderia adhaesiva TaxID=2883244 RepID=UPI001F287365|nr:hypothetical protein [Paraburkholderia adhaesiva]